MNANMNTLLICSVGGTPEPVAASIRAWKPARILFLCSTETRPQTDIVLRMALTSGDVPISTGSIDYLPLQNPQDLEQTLRDLRPLDRDVREWQQRGVDYQVAVDFTGGTKVMSAALALVARRWACTFVYVGGDQRTKEGIGIVVSGSERPSHQLNPWDALGYQVIEEAIAVFNGGGYASAASLLDSAIKNTARSEVKRELSTLKAVVDAYSAWDRFDHNGAKSRFDDALKNRNDLEIIFSGHASPFANLERHRREVDSLAKTTEPTITWVIDLVGNARRRAAEGRYDDAVARLYRAFEALAQIRLREQYGIADTKSIPFDRLPEPLREGWKGRAHNDAVTLGLRDVYLLLRELGDDLGRRFSDLKLDDNERSPLVARNQSILAHGFQSVSKDAYAQLYEKLCSLDSFEISGFDEWRLPVPQG